MANKHDPRVDPRPDDIVAKVPSVWIIVAERTDGVKYRVLGTSSGEWSTLAEWREWAKRTEVIHAVAE